ncbi:hypothetical protein JYU34_020071 [Plutella xylostella]|uniref:Secreted protein n=1 Tax=Plutella xylostella TaxID=51655 RepID=A0ABQ7PVW5_PLUXY|nr:hypothetical protein JYU34_020071 [Plutella xylostella]
MRLIIILLIALYVILYCFSKKKSGSGADSNNKSAKALPKSCPPKKAGYQPRAHRIQGGCGTSTPCLTPQPQPPPRAAPCASYASRPAATQYTGPQCPADCVPPRSNMRNTR